MRHDFDDGKYTVIFDEKTGKMEALRHGEPWQVLCGNNLVYFMLAAYDSASSETAQLQARVAELEAALRVAAESIIKLESIATESGAEAYDIACEEMEAWQAKRRKAGKEVGTQGSLVDGLAWVYERLDDLESGQ